MLSPDASVVVEVLRRHPSGVSRQAIIELSRIGSESTLMALQEIGDLFDLKRWRDGEVSMYRLSESDVDAFSAEREVLSVMLRHKTRIHSRTIAQAAHMLQHTVNDVLSDLVHRQIISLRIPGTYHVTLSGLHYIRSTYPTMKLPDGIDKRCEFEDTEQKNTQAFSLGTFTLQIPKSYRPRKSLKNPADTINLVHGLSVNLPKRNQQQLAELIEFLMYHTLPRYEPEPDTSDV